MNIVRYPDRANWDAILRRPASDPASLESTVKNILSEIRDQGDEAVRKFTLQFDKADVHDLELTTEELEEAEGLLSEDLKGAIRVARDNIEKFHRAQLNGPQSVETMPGVKCWRKSVAIEKVGLYIPGGTAPLFSTILMLGIPAALAGCRQVILCSPPNTKGQLHPAILFTARLVGISRIFRVGGVQAIGAMTYGTASIPKVYKIFGPGNQYVTCAKQIVQQQGVAIDLPAGPSELAVYADQTARPSFVAADLLSQAEHAVDSQVLLVSDQQIFLDAVIAEIDKQLVDLPRKAIAARALENSIVLLVKDEAEAIEVLNQYAPEHLILACNNAEALADRIINAGSVFLGHFTPESVGDYASGTNHTLPTNGFARAYGGVSVDSFMKSITFQKLTEQGLRNIANTVELMAQAEGLDAHRNAVTIRTSAKS